MAKGPTWFSTLWPMGGVLSASLLIAWATEVLSFFISRGLAFAVLALLQVLPEFAVEAVITLDAAANPDRVIYVTANFTGANRLIVGLFLPMVFLMAFVGARRRGQRLRHLELEDQSSVEIMALVAATIWAFVIAAKGSLGLLDAAVLVAIYVTYLYIMYRLPPSEEVDEELPLVPRKIRGYATRHQKMIIVLFFLIGGALLFLSVEPFYHNTLALGELLLIPAYFLLQWLAPFLSEFPEFITIVYWGKTGRATHGLTNAISSNVGQLTLLIAMIPIVYLFGTWSHGSAALSLHFHGLQRLEIFLTAAQLLFAVCCLLNLRFTVWEALTLLCLWLVQLLDPFIDEFLPANLPSPFGSEHFIREYVTIIYLLLCPWVVYRSPRRFAAFPAFRAVVRNHLLSPKNNPLPPPEPGET